MLESDPSDNDGHYKGDTATLPRIQKTTLPRIQRTTLPRRLVCWKSRINEAGFVFCTSCFQT
ncbi:unnamed protein product, partial [Didymodactylos carnosus]